MRCELLHTLSSCNTFMMSSRNQPRSFVSARDVADRAGVSRSAVSRAFTPGASVSAAVRQRVLKSADELGYFVNQLARSLHGDESGIVCLIVAAVATPYHSSLLRALTLEVQAAGKLSVVINTTDDEESVDRALQQVVQYRADAAVVLSGEPTSEIGKLCLRSGQRLVLISREDELQGALRINTDDEAAAARCALAFARAGCRRLAFANSELGTPSLAHRERGFARAAQELGLPVQIVRHGYTNYDAGAELARRLLTQFDRPDAVFCANDLIACGFLDVARRHFGLNVPEQLCVAGFDDIEQASWASYQLTTFSQPVKEIATRAVRWICDNTGTGQSDDVVLPAEVVWRSTIRGG